MKQYSLLTETIFFNPKDRRSWKDGGDWPHESLYYYYEAFVAAYFTMRGFHVIRDYVATRNQASRNLTTNYTRIFHDVVGEMASRFFTEELDKYCPAGRGQPDLFVFREEFSNDPRVKYPDPSKWFFVEVKGPRDQVSENQKRFWRAVAERTDIGLGPERIRLFRVLPEGATDAEAEVWY